MNFFFSNSKPSTKMSKKSRSLNSEDSQEAQSFLSIAKSRISEKFNVGLNKL